MIKNIRNITVFVLLNFCANYCSAQTIDSKTFELWNANIVEIHAENKSGCGFIVADKEGTFYIVTAAHVVEGLITADINFSDAKHNGKATVIKSNEFYDIAVLAMPDQNINWEPFPYISNATGGDAVFVITLREGRMILTNNGSAIITSLDKEVIDCNVGIKQGDSGTPILCTSGVLGIICKDPGRGRPITMVKDLIESWNIPWQIPESEIVRQTEVQQTIPDTEQEEILPIRSIAQSETGKDLPQLHDGNNISSVNFPYAGQQTLYLKLNREFLFNKLRIFFPTDFNDHMSKGYIYLPGNKKKIKLGKIKVPVMQKEENGNWLIYDLKHYYRETTIQLVFNVHKIDEHEAMTVYIFEIQIVLQQTN